MLENGRHYYQVVGDTAGLLALSDIYKVDKPRIIEYEGEFYIDTDKLQTTVDLSGADDLLRDMIGAARASGHFNKANLSIGSATTLNEDSTKVISMRADFVLGFHASITATVVGADGKVIPNPRSLATRILEFIESNSAPQAAKDIHKILRKDSPDLPDLYNAMEALMALNYHLNPGVQSQFKDFKRNVCNWEVMDSGARHYKDKKVVPPSNPMTPDQAKELMMHFIRDYFDQNAPP